MGQLSRLQKEQIEGARSMSIYKRDDMIQKGRFKLSKQEQRAVLYAISKIKPTDTHLTEYVFDIRELYRIIGWEKESYTEFKAMLLALKSKSWWAEIDDKGTESAVSWFSTVRVNKRTGKVTLKFHEDMLPFLIQLTEQGEFYTFYNLKCVLPMSSKHSPRLYEILKSYQKNNREWFFETDKLKRLMDSLSYKNFNDFKRFVLDPAVEEINKYTDLRIKYILQREGRRVARVHFLMDEKTISEKFKADMAVDVALDGQLNLFESDEITRAKAEWLQERRTAKKGE